MSACRITSSKAFVDRLLRASLAIAFGFIFLASRSFAAEPQSLVAILQQLESSELKSDQIFFRELVNQSLGPSKSAFGKFAS